MRRRKSQAEITLENEVTRLNDIIGLLQEEKTRIDAKIEVLEATRDSILWQIAQTTSNRSTKAPQKAPQK